MYHRESLTGLTSVRLWAASMVVTVHYLAVWPTDNSILLTILSNGGMWVAFFFVLSGFILAWNYHGEFAPAGPGERKPPPLPPGAYRRFLQRRMARLYPMYLLCLVVLTGAYFVEGFALAPFPNPGPLVLVTSWITNLLALQVWVPNQIFHEYWNTPAWTVSVEMAFYLCFPFVLARMPRGEKALPAAVVIFLAGALMTFVVSYFIYPGSGPDNVVLVMALIRLPVANFWVFLFGAAVGLAWVHRAACLAEAERSGESAPGNGRSLGATVALALLFSVTLFWRFVVPYPPAEEGFLGFLLWTFTRYDGFYVYVPLFGALIYLLAGNRHHLAGFFARPTVYFLGEASYALYLWHWLILLFFRKYGVVSASPRLALVASLAVSAILAILSYRYVEEPLRRRLTAGLALRSKDSQVKLSAGVSANLG